MTVRVAIVNYSKVSEASKQIKGVEYDALQAVYEAGMKDVLKELAISKMMEWENCDKTRSTAYNKASDKAGELYDELSKTLSEEQKRILSDIEATYNQVTMIESDESFVAGFMMGYQYLRTLKESWRGDHL